MIEIPIILLGYNPNYTPIGVVVRKVREKTFEKLKGLAVYMVVRKKDEFFILVSRKSEPIVEPLVAHEFCYLSRGDTVEQIVDLTVEKFYKDLQSRISFYQEDSETCIKYHLPILREKND